MRDRSRAAAGRPETQTSPGWSRAEPAHGRFRDECLNREQFWTLTEARVVIEDYRHRYNRIRPHSKLGYQSPAHFAQPFTPSPAPLGDGQTQNPQLNTPNNIHSD